MTPILNYLKSGTLPAERKGAKRLTKDAQNYTLIHGVLYRRGFSNPLLRCVPTSETKNVLEEVHGGMCGNHLGARALSKKVVRAGFYWPTLQRDATEFVKICPPAKNTPISTRHRQKTLSASPHHGPSQNGDLTYSAHSPKDRGKSNTS